MGRIALVCAGETLSPLRSLGSGERGGEVRATFGDLGGTLGCCSTCVFPCEPEMKYVIIGCYSISNSRAIKWEISGLVYLQIAFGCKCFATNRAFEWPVAGMRPHVNL